MEAGSSTQIIEIHYYFSDDSHTLNARAFNKSHASLIALTQELSDLLSVEIEMEVLPLQEGGLKNAFKFTGKYLLAPAVPMLVTHLLAYYITHDTELDELTKDKLRLEIEQMKKASLSSEEEELVEKAANKRNEISTSLKLKKHRSDFYKAADSVQKVEQLSACLLDGDGKSLREAERTVHRGDFHKFILESEDLPDEIDEDATIEIISPVLVPGKYKWRGKYRDDVIDFSLSDQDFRRDIYKKRIQFSNGDIISVRLVISKKLDDFGNITSRAYRVEEVLAYDHGDGFTETTKGHKARQSRSDLDFQGSLFESPKKL